MPIQIESITAKRGWRTPQKIPPSRNSADPHAPSIREDNYGFETGAGVFAALVGTASLVASFFPEYKPIANYCYIATVGSYAFAAYVLSHAWSNFNHSREQKRKKSVETLTE